MAKKEKKPQKPKAKSGRKPSPRSQPGEKSPSVKLKHWEVNRPPEHVPTLTGAARIKYLIDEDLKLIDGDTFKLTYLRDIGNHVEELDIATSNRTTGSPAVTAGSSNTAVDVGLPAGSIAEPSPGATSLPDAEGRATSDPVPEPATNPEPTPEIPPTPHVEHDIVESDPH